MVMTPTKAHSQFMPALTAVSKSLADYGHGPIELVFTDNPCLDKNELESSIPSLLKDITPVPPSSLETLSIPQGIEILLLSSAYQVNTRLSSIMEHIKHNDEFFVALDMEWSVNREIGIQGRVALISITYGKEIFLLPVGYTLNSIYIILSDQTWLAWFISAQ